MFKFNFDIDDSEDNGSSAVQQSSSHTDTEQTQDCVVEDNSKEVSLENLLSTLPYTISFSPLRLSASSRRGVVLSRRDLFDARFQLISADDGASTKNGLSEVDFVDEPSDLVPGVYEGGLKTWECSLDLVECLDSIYGSEITSALERKRILELGCGTAVPSLYLIHSIFATEPSADADIHVHLQDYNELVLRLVTIPNIILAWYMSPASSTYRTGTPTQDFEKSAQDNDDDLVAIPLPPPDPSEPGELPLTLELKAAFLESLKAHGIHLKLFSGSWSTFDVGQAGGPYDILLTSETIYRTASLKSLVDLMRRAMAARNDSVSLEDAALRQSLSDSRNLAALAGAPYLCLVAAKLVYFGVGGGVNEFVRAVEDLPERGGSDSVPSKTKVRTIWETTKGVKRSVMSVVWGK